MRKKRNEDLLAETIDELKRHGLSEPLPKDVVDETVRQIAACGLRPADSGPSAPSIRNLTGWRFKFAAAAAMFLLVGYLVGRLTSPDVEQLREALTPSVASALEPVLRQKLGEEMRGHWQVALAATYVRLKDDITQQYRDDLNRFAIQTLAASNATTNALLRDLVQAIDTTQAQDRRRMALAISEIEAKRMQDRAQLATGIVTLASRTDDELTRTREALARLLIDEPLQRTDLPQQSLKNIPNERSKE
jgi:hypothetical protein